MRNEPRCVLKLFFGGKFCISRKPSAAGMFP